MGLRDFLSNVVTRYQAETKEHISALNELAGAELDREKKTRDAVKNISDSYGKLTEVARRSFDVATDALKAYANHSKLVAAAGAADIDRLEKASAGLKTEMQLLGDAARFNSGQFKLNNEQMEIAERAILAFTRQNKDAAKSTEAVLNAVTALKVDGLEDMGVHVDKAGLSMDKAADRTKIWERTIEALTIASRTAGDQVLTDAEKYDRASVHIENAVDRIKRGAGGALDFIGDNIGKYGAIEAYKFIGAKDAANSIAEGYDVNTAGKLSLEELTLLRIQRARRAADAAARGDAFTASQLSSGRDTFYVDPNQLKDALSSAAGVFGSTAGNTFYGSAFSGLDLGAKGPTGSTAAISDIKNVWDRTIEQAIADLIVNPIAESLKEHAGEQTETLFESPALVDARSMAQVDAAFKSLSSTSAEATSRGERYGDYQHAKAGSRLEAMFGPIEEFNVYQTAFKGLSGAVSSAMGAWIDGSVSAGAAVKKFIGEFLKAEAIELGVQALKHGAFAIGSLAFGDLRGAAQHGQAAAMFGIAAVAAAAGAKQLGGGGASAGGAGAGAGGRAAPTISGTPYYNGKQIVYVVGDSLGETSPRKAANKLQRRAQETLGGAGVMYE